MTQLGCSKQNKLRYINDSMKSLAKYLFRQQIVNAIIMLKYRKPKFQTRVTNMLSNRAEFSTLTKDVIDTYILLFSYENFYLVLLMICTPESVITASLSSPTLRAQVASSNGFCICPRPNGPKSPPLLADEQSENCEAKSSNFASSLTICSR